MAKALFLMQRAGHKVGGRKFPEDRPLARMIFIDDTARALVTEALRQVYGVTVIEHELARPDATESRDLLTLDGIGPATARRLIEAGIATIDDLAGILADPVASEELAAKAKINRTDIDYWRRQLGVDLKA